MAKKLLLIAEVILLHKQRTSRLPTEMGKAHSMKIIKTWFLLVFGSQLKKMERYFKGSLSGLIFHLKLSTSRSSLSRKTSTTSAIAFWECSSKQSTEERSPSLPKLSNFTASNFSTRHIFLTYPCKCLKKLLNESYQRTIAQSWDVLLEFHQRFLPFLELSPPWSKLTSLTTWRKESQRHRKNVRKHSYLTRLWTSWYLSSSKVMRQSRVMTRKFTVLT